MAFNDVKPACIELSRFAFLPTENFDPNSKDLLGALIKLEGQLSKYQDGSLSTRLADYIFVPISSLLKQKALGDQQTEQIILLLYHLLRLCWSSDGTFPQALAKQLFPLITFLISPDKENKKLKNRASEFKNIAVKTLCQFFKSLKAQPYHYVFFLNEEGSPLFSLGHGITILLDIILENPTESALQIHAIRALRILYHDIIKDGEILSFVLPGNVSTFAKVLCAPGITVHSKVVLEVLSLLGSLLQVVYDDMILEVNLVDKITDLKDLNIEDNMEEEEFGNLGTKVIIEETKFQDLGKNRHRTTSWLRGTSGQVKLALQSFIPKLIQRENKQIEVALAEFVSKLLERCEKSLNNCEVLFIKTLLDLRLDPNYLINNHINVLKNILMDDVNKLNDYVQFENIRKINSLRFAINIISERESNPAWLLEITSKLVACLTYIPMEKQYSLKLRKEKKIAEQNSNIIVSGMKPFDEIRSNTLVSKAEYLPTSEKLIPQVSKEMEVIIQNIINTLGSVLRKENKLETVVDYLLSERVESPVTEKSMTLWTSTQLLVENHVVDTNMDSFINIDGFSPLIKYDTSCFAILEYCNDFFQEITFSLEGQIMDKDRENAICIILNSITLISRIMKDDFESELIDYLYIIIDNLASSSARVREFAQICSLSVADELYDGSVDKLILNNVDYLVESISMRLNSGMINHVSVVLMVICKIAGFQTIQSFKDVIETIFKLLESYHGYSELCLEFFQLFEVILLEMKKEYLVVGDMDSIKRITNERIITSSFKPWGLENIEQALEALKTWETSNIDSQVSDDTFDENEPRNFQEYFDSRLREVDSDDESDVDSTFDKDEDKGANDEEEEEEKQEEKWVSPIPQDAYKIMLQILGYGDRLLTHPSKPLQIQILKVINLMIPMLSTQHNLLLPQTAQIWDGIVDCVVRTDYSIVKASSECLQTLIHYSGDFISKRFCDLWEKLNKESFILRDLKRNNSNDREDQFQVGFHVKFPPVTRDALVSVSNMLLEGISITEMLISETVITDMVYCCLHVLPREKIASNSLVLADIVWSIVN